MKASAPIKTVSIARARITRATGEKEVHYSVEKVPFWHVRRQIKLKRHLSFMKREDRVEGWK